MWTLYDNILSLCKDKGIKGGKMCVDLGLSKSLMTDLKAGRKKSINSDTAKKIADYFGVSVDRVVGGSEQKETAPVLTEKDERDIARDVQRMMEDLEHSGELMFDGVPMSQEARDSMAAAMKLGLQAARIRNKETYTPKKYKKVRE